MFQQVAVRTIPYSQFKAHLARREVIEAAVNPDEVLGRIVPLAARQTNAAPGRPVIAAAHTNEDIPVSLHRALSETKPFLFRTVRVEDPDLVKELQAAGAEYGGVRPGFITQFLLAWVLPIAIMIALWTFIGRRLGATGESVLGFGKSRARLIADKNTGVTFNDVAGCDEAKVQLKEVVEMDGEEVKKLLDRGYAEAKEILTLHRDQLERIAAELLQRESIDGARFYQLVGRGMPTEKIPVPPLAAAPATAQDNTELRP